MSWNPSPSLGGANWQGNAPLATKNQLVSSINGIYLSLSNYDFSTISLSTLTIPDWISTSVLYVSDIQGANISISGITIDSKGIFNAPIVSVSSMNLKGFELGFDVNFDFGLGKAIGGVVGGLGAAVGGGLIAVGTGVGLAIQGAATGAATLIAGRPQNFISQTEYETINFTSQLQISTLGNAYPTYSSIFRTVSSISPNQIPGLEIYTSSLFSPGQICIRSVSDPFNLMSGNSNLNSSTIQSFGQWVPLTGLEPENIVANSVSTNTLEADTATILSLQSFNIASCNLGIGTAAFFNYQAPLNFDLGTLGDANINGNLNQWNFQTNQPIVFSQLGDPGTLTPGATLTLGTGFQSIFAVSTINTNFLKSVNLFASSIIAENITAVSTLFITSTNVEFITSTQIVVADLGQFSSIKLSTIQELGLTSLNSYPGAITAINTLNNTTAPVVGIGFKGQFYLDCNAQTRVDYNFNGITGTSNATNYFPVATFEPNNVIPWSLSNISKTYTSTLNTNTISTQSVYASDISSATLEVFGTINNQNGLLISQEGIFSSIITLTGESFGFSQIATNYLSNFFPPSMLSSPITSVSTTVLTSYYELDAINTPIYLSPGSLYDMTLSKLGAYYINGIIQTGNYFGRDIIVTPGDNTFQVYTDNGGFGLASNLQVVNLSNNSAFFIRLYINAPSSAMTIPSGGSVGIYWNNSGNTFVSTPYYSWPLAAQSNTANLTQNYTGLTLDTPSLTLTSNITINGTLATVAPSYGRVGIEMVTYTDQTLSWTNIGGAEWESAAQNPIPRPGGGFYSSTEWTPVVNAQQVIMPSGTTALITFAFKPTVNAGFWDVYRYVKIESAGPTLGEVDYTCLMIPNNFIV